MKKSKVYIGIYNGNNQESLFYQKNPEIFYDLKQKKNVSSSEIEKNSLVPYNDIIKCKKVLKKNIIKLYDLDRIEKVSLNNIFIGNSYKITKVMSKGTPIRNSESITHIEREIFEKDLLLIFIGNYYDRFKNIETGNFYGYPFNPSKGDIYIDIDGLKPAAIELGIDKQKIEKGKLLEKYRDYKRR